MKYAIIGNGVAGTTAALNIRKFDPEGEIFIITDEDIPFYSRIRLPEYLSNTLDEKRLIIHDDSWYENLKLTLITNRRVKSIDRGGKYILLEGETRIPYDKLLIATGGKANVPSLTGVLKKGVFTLRTIADAREMRLHAQNASDIVILGGGVLGLEVANALRKAGKSVTIAEYFPRLLPRQMDEAGSRIFKEKLESAGLRFVLDARAEEVLGSKQVEGLRLQNGVSLQGQMLVISAGSNPDISLLSGTGIRTARGIPVNNRMETELPNVYAAGDVAEHAEKIYGIWPAAEKQGEIAGVNMAGGNALYNGTIPSNSITVAGIEVTALGEIDLDCKLPSIVYNDNEKGIYRKIIVIDDCAAGCILCGETDEKKEVMAAVRERRPISEMKETLEKLELKWMR